MDALSSGMVTRKPGPYFNPEWRRKRTDMERRARVAAEVETSAELARIQREEAEYENVKLKRRQQNMAKAEADKYRAP